MTMAAPPLPPSSDMSELERCPCEWIRTHYSPCRTIILQRARRAGGFRKRRKSYITLLCSSLQRCLNLVEVGTKEKKIKNSVVSTVSGLRRRRRRQLHISRNREWTCKSYGKQTWLKSCLFELKGYTDVAIRSAEKKKPLIEY